MSAWRDKEEFKARVLEWADKLDVRVRSLTVRPMRNKWASCSTAGNLNFNAELLALDRELGDYVIVHELLHFFVPNHGKLWKSLMHAHLGDFKGLEDKLKQSVGPGASSVTVAH
ncbi:MAG: M48 family metallopeptidase [Chromatiales bacterium]